MAYENIEDVEKIIEWNKFHYGLGNDEENLSNYDSVHVKVYRENGRIVWEEPQSAGVMQKVEFSMDSQTDEILTEVVYQKSVMPSASDEEKEYREIE